MNKMAKIYLEEVTKELLLEEVEELELFSPFFATDFADLSVIDEHGLSFEQAYCYFSFSPRLALLKLMRAKSPIPIDHPDKFGNTLLSTALMDSAGEKLYEFVPYLIE